MPTEHVVEEKKVRKPKGDSVGGWHAPIIQDIRIVLLEPDDSIVIGVVVVVNNSSSTLLLVVVVIVHNSTCNSNSAQW